MFKRFTAQARDVVVLAQEEARTLKHNYVGTEHLLLGLLGEQHGTAARVLESFEITVERVRSQVVRIVGSGKEVTSGQIPFTPRAKQVLELALREALSLGRDNVGTEHILLGLGRDNEGVAARILFDFGADFERIHQEVIRVLSVPSAGAPPLVPASPRGSAEVEPGLPGIEGEAMDAAVDLGWRGRSIALATLGAAVLTRSAFDPAGTGMLAPLEMQVLAYLTLEASDERMNEPGGDVSSLSYALRCDVGELEVVIDSLTARQLLAEVTDEYADDERQLAVTDAGAIMVTDWLSRVTPLFRDWPADRPTVDDATA